MRSRVRSRLAALWKERIRVALESLRAACLPLFASSQWLAGVYSCLVSGGFRREHLAVLKGRAAYYQSLAKIDTTSPLLRRNIHRLEKGLIMQPRRAIFAQDFILETVRCYRRAMVRPGFAAEELRWAADVLDAYFSVVEDAPSIHQARQEYARLQAERDQAKRSHGLPCTPFPFSSRPEAGIAYEQLTALFRRRRSVRWYQQRPVPFALIQQAINAAALAPSACNRQPYRFVVATDPDQATAIARCAWGTAGFAHQLPAMIVVVGDLSAYPHERDRHLIYIDASLASMQLMLAAETLGLSTCPINWPDVASSERKLQRILGLPGYERVVMLLSIGYGEPSGGIPFSQKKQNRQVTQRLADS